MQEPDRDQVIEEFNQLFGYGWRKLYSEAIGISPETITKMKQGATLRHAAALAEFFESSPPKNWPPRFDALRKQHLAKIQRDKERNAKDANE